MKIVFFEIQGWEKKHLKKGLPGHQLTFVEDPLTEANVKLAAEADAVSVFIYSHVSAPALAKMKQLKLVATRSTGYDHIDLDVCKKRGIAVCNVPFYGENTVAEHTFALILALSRNVHKSYMRTLRNNYSIDGLIGFDLKGKTLGVVGTGHIGMHVIKIAKGFGMNVVAFDVNQHPFLAEVLGFTYVDFDTLLAASDIISLHAPYNNHTHHMINQDNVGKIKKGALLINTSRGGLCETEALIQALDNDILSGIGLDVVEGEDLIKEEKQLLYDADKQEALGNLVKNHILLSHDRVVFTPHIAFYSQEALLRILETTIENVVSFAAGNLKQVVA